jgi:hypothetical protein
MPSNKFLLNQEITIFLSGYLTIYDYHAGASDSTFVARQVVRSTMKHG